MHFQRLPILRPGHIFAHISLVFLHLIQDIGSPIFRTSHEGPEPRSHRRRIAFTKKAMAQRGDKGRPPIAEPERSF